MKNKPVIQLMTELDFVLRGEKVLLRRFTASDINKSYIGWLNDPDVVRFSNQRFLKHNKKSCLQYLKSFERTDNLFISIRCLSSGRQIGTLTAYVSNHHGTVDVGILIGEKNLWGKGFGLDAWVTFINWIIACKGIRKVTAGTLACNHGMIKLMERSGMHHEATRQAQEIIDSKEVDIKYYAKFSVD